MEKFLKPKFSKIIKTESEENPNLAKFTFDKLSKGFGQTIGTSLRRTILSTMPGAAPFAIEAKGVSHEFQAIDNLKEDAVELILNIKELIIEVNEELIDLDEIYEFKLISSGEGAVLAGDIKIPEGFKIINTDLVIANALKNKALELIIHVTYSRGYKTFEENKVFVKNNLDSKIGIIAMDSLYSNVKSVNFKIEEVNPGETNVFERLILEVETKGTSFPEKIVAQAASVLENYFKAFSELFEINLDEQFIEEVEEIEEDTHLLMTVESLNLSVRSENALKAAGIKTVEELVDRPVSALQEIKNLGEKSKIEIIQVVQDIGLSFKSE